MKILLCNMSWMRHYRGVPPDDPPTNGGAFVREHGFGHEAINFEPFGGRVYGFVQLRAGTIKVSRLEPNARDKADNVLVVWRARSTGRGSVIVGWYKNATVFHSLQEALPGRSFRYKGETIFPKWVISAKESDAIIVPPEHRSFRVPVSHKGFGSQTFVSFLDSELQEVAQFKEELLQYIADVESGSYPPRHGTKLQIDQNQKLKIEKAAIEAAFRYYGDQGYDVTSVERENAGYDLEARCNDETLLVEVKGTNQNTDNAIINLSPNEYEKSKARKRQYRICIVTKALSSSEAKVNDFLWYTDEETWRDENTGKCLSVKEVTSANMAIK